MSGENYSRKELGLFLGPRSRRQRQDQERASASALPGQTEPTASASDACRTCGLLLCVDEIPPLL